MSDTASWPELASGASHVMDGYGTSGPGAHAGATDIALGSFMNAILHDS